MIIETNEWTSDEAIQNNVQHWIEELRQLVPPGTPVSNTVRVNPKKQFSVVFKVALPHRLMASVAHDYQFDRAVNDAGSALCRQIVSFKNKNVTKRRKASRLLKERRFYVKEVA